MTSVLCSLPQHLSLFTVFSWYLEAGVLCCAAISRPIPIPAGLFLQFLKSLCGMIQSQRRNQVERRRGCRVAVGIYKCCGCGEIWEPYFNMCERGGDTCAQAWMYVRERADTSYTRSFCGSVVISLCVSGVCWWCLCESGVCWCVCLGVCVCTLGGACMGGFVCTFDTSLTGS